MLPNSLQLNVFDCGLGNTKQLSEFGLTDFSTSLSNKTNVNFCQFCRTVSLTNILRSVNNLVLFILGLCFPFQMVRRNTDWVSASVCSLMLITWGRSIHQFTNEAMRILFLSERKLWVAFSGLRIRPEKTIVSGVKKNSCEKFGLVSTIAKVYLRFSHFSLSERLVRLERVASRHLCDLDKC